MTVNVHEVSLGVRKSIVELENGTGAWRAVVHGLTRVGHN